LTQADRQNKNESYLANCFNRRQPNTVEFHTISPCSGISSDGVCVIAHHYSRLGCRTYCI